MLVMDCMSGIYLLGAASIQMYPRSLEGSAARPYRSSVDGFENPPSFFRSCVRPGLNFLCTAQTTGADLLFIEAADADAGCLHMVDGIGDVGANIHLIGTIHCRLRTAPGR